MHINLHTNKENRCVYKYIYILKIHCPILTCILIVESPHIFQFPRDLQESRQRHSVPFSSKKPFPKKPIKASDEETKMPTIRASKFLPPFESAGFVVMAKRAVSRERERARRGDRWGSLWSGTVYRILSDYAKSLMEITVVSKWREDILTVPRELR